MLTLYDRMDQKARASAEKTSNLPLFFCQKMTKSCIDIRQCSFSYKFNAWAENASISSRIPTPNFFSITFAASPRLGARVVML